MLGFGVALGVGLAAACGLRVFLPVLVAGVAARMGLLTLVPELAWMASDLAVVLFGVATVLEVGAYHVPILDHMLDVLGGPSAVLAGAVVAASGFGELDPVVRWAAALAVGGGVAGALHGGMAAVRAASTAVTGGLANPVVATVETGSALALSVLALVLPWFAAGVVVLIGALLLRWAARRRSA